MVTSEDEVMSIVIGGEVDLVNRDQLQSCLANIDVARARLVHLDLRQLTFCDSAGSAHLVRFENRARAAGCAVQIRDVQPIVRKVMDLVATGIE
ncbi:STAS domain-containing protein [Nocardioides panacis]|uniref:STAS domain-containing protein n=1 Tax=Nocardioides panacis TaxID=2849501 RepID=A0A975T1Z5_9ACTN|nr:STAS domain-containing protein [Nocardioides panacis]QWZ10183.1 STAS domain-containing protein [Nocardioides panacis]